MPSQEEVTLNLREGVLERDLKGYQHLTSSAFRLQHFTWIAVASSGASFVGVECASSSTSIETWSEPTGDSTSQLQNQKKVPTFWHLCYDLAPSTNQGMTHEEFHYGQGADSWQFGKRCYETLQKGHLPQHKKDIYA